MKKIVLIFSMILFSLPCFGENKDFLIAYPTFSSESSSPRFTVEYKNEGKATEDLAKFYMGESIVIDGKEYKRQESLWGGISSLAPGQVWFHTIDLKEFLPGAIVEENIQKLPLNKGDHALVINFAGKKSELIRFEWMEGRSDPTSSPKLAEKPWTVYEMKLVQLRDEPEKSWAYVIGYSAFRTEQALKDWVAQLPAGSTLKWDKAFCLPVLEAPFGSPKSEEDFRNFCKARKINLEFVAHP